jgi:hypothetical protein
MFAVMAGTVLKNILSFTGLVTGIPVALPHDLTLNTIPVIPCLIALNAGGFTVTAGSLFVTVTRTASALSGSVEVYCEQWHTIEAVEPPGGLTGFFPFIINGGIASAGGGLTPPFNYVATGLENPAGFVIPFPSGSRGAVPYVAIVQVSNYQAGGIVGAAAPPSGYTSTGITVETSQQLAAGDTVAVVIADG